MKIGILGLPQTGKRSLVELLTGRPLPPGAKEKKKPVPARAVIRDARFDALSSLYKPKKTAPALIDFSLMPKIEPDSGQEYTHYNDLADADALCHVVRGFKDDSVFHSAGSVNPARDIDAVNTVFILHDLIFTEKRIERIKKDIKKKNDPASVTELELMERFHTLLEDEKPLRGIELTPDEKKPVASYPLLTLKELFVVLNTDEDGLTDNTALTELETRYEAKKLPIIPIAIQLEQEIASLDTEEERKEFMDDAGITEPALERLSHHAMDSLGLISFFTVGSDEVKQWPIRRGSSAKEAAGTIHSDIERGFIRAEVMKYDELIELGSEESLKKAGKVYLMGKDYIVEDGDIINFRFNI